MKSGGRTAVPAATLAGVRATTTRPVHRTDLDGLLGTLREAEPLPGHDRVYVPGELEWLAEEDRRRNGIPLHPKVVADLESLATETGVPLDARLG